MTLSPTMVTSDYARVVRQDDPRHTERGVTNAPARSFNVWDSAPQAIAGPLTENRIDQGRQA